MLACKMKFIKCVIKCELTSNFDNKSQKHKKTYERSKISSISYNISSAS